MAHAVLTIPKRITTSGLVLFLLCLMYFITYVDRVNVGTAAPIIKAELGLSNTDLGLIWAGSTALTGLAGGVLSLFLFRFALGFGEGATFPTATRAMQSWVPAEERGFAQGITHAFARFGNAITPPLVVGLMALLTWRGSFVVLGVVSFAWVVVWYWYYRDDPRDHKGITQEELARLPLDARKGGPKPPIPWRRLVARMWPVTVTYFCYGWSLWLYLNWLPSFFKEGYQLDIKNSSLFASGVFFAGVVGDTAGGMISDRILKNTGDLQKARRNVISVSMLGAAVCLLGVFFSRDLTTIALLLSAGFFCLELVIGPIWAVPMDIAPRYAGTASGLMNFGSAVAAIISPLVFGLVVDLTGNWTLPFIGSVALLVAGAALAFLMHPERPFRDDPAALGARPVAAE